MRQQLEADLGMVSVSPKMFYATAQSKTVIQFSGKVFYVRKKSNNTTHTNNYVHRTFSYTIESRTVHHANIFKNEFF
jgi:hypothetical protein